MTWRFLTAAVLFTGWAPVSRALTVMPLGDSGTVGVDYYTQTAGGFRDPLYRDLAASGLPITFVGANNADATPELTAAKETFHNGYGSYRIDNVLDNLDANTPPQAADGNQGGYWLTGGHDTKRNAVKPDIVLVEIGANDILQHFDSQTPHPTEEQFLADLEQRLSNLLTKFHELSPSSILLVAEIYPFKHSPTFNVEIQAYNTYIKTKLVPSFPYTRAVDQYSPFIAADGSVRESLLGNDNVHPTRYGYPLMALQWAEAIRKLEGNKPALYPLTVTGGLGGGSYPEGSIVTIEAAAAPSGQQFAGWSPPTNALFNVYWPVATFTMPAAPAKLAVHFADAGSPAIPDGIYDIVAYWDGLSLGAAASSGVIAQQQTYTGAATQQWKLTNLGKNQAELSLPGTELALTADESATAASAKIDVETYTGAPNQQWIITPVLGTTELVNVKTGTAAAILGYQSNPGVPITQNPAGYIAGQTWGFFPVAPSDAAKP